MAQIFVLGGHAESLIGFRGPMLQEMVAGGNEVYACAPDAPKEIREALSDLGVVYQDIELDRTRLSPIRDAYLLISLVKFFKKIKPDIFLGYTIKPVIYGSLAARLSGVPMICSMITGLGYAFSVKGIKARMVGLIARMLYRLALRFNRKIFFQNPDNLHYFLDKCLIKNTEKTVLINGSGVDIEMFHPVSYPAPPSFLLIARLLKDKGIYEYIKAARIVRRTHPTARFRLAGFFDKNPNSISEADLRAWIEDGVIEYLGFLRDVRTAIADASVYVLPSYHEGTPRTVLEAMAMARPIVTTDAPGCRETVQQGENGFLVPVKEVQPLAEAMEYFIKQPEKIKTMGAVSRQIAEAKYDVHKVNAVILSSMNLP